MESYVVPETPDQRPARRRSSRRSTMLSSMASDSLMRKVCGTPMSQDSVTFVSESPANTLKSGDDRRRKSVSVRAAQIGISESSEKRERKGANFHPVFAPTKTGEEGTEKSDDTFEMYVPATQDLPETIGKVQAWLNSDPNPSVKKKRRSNIQDVSKYLTGNDSSTKEHLSPIRPPRRPPSFQDYSSESAKAMLAQFEAQSKQPEAIDLDATPELSPKITQHDQMDNDTLNKVLDGVTAFVEVRSKNENRSDVVIDQLVALGAEVLPRLNNRYKFMLIFFKTYHFQLAIIFQSHPCCVQRRKLDDL